MLPKDFYKTVETIEYLKNVLYSDTDSVYLCIPWSKEHSLKDRWDKSIDVSEKINNAIIRYLKEYIFKLSNIDPKYNKTFFKTESLINSILFLPDSKKHYAYKLLVAEGVFLEKPKTKYKNISIKSNLSKMSSDLLRDMVEIILNIDKTNIASLKTISAVVDKWHNIFKEHILNYVFEDIGIPNKWAKSTQIINGMRVYNLIIGKQIFTPGSAGKYVYCNFKNKGFFMQDKEIDLKNLNVITVPYTYDANLLKTKMIEYQIDVDLQTHWDKCIMTKTTHKLLDVMRNTQSKLIQQ